MYYRRFFGFLPLLVVSFVLGCGEKKGDESGLRIFLDDRGREVALPGQVARVISLAPSFTEIIYALGAEEKLVGVTTYCDYPAEAKLKPRVGDFLNPSLERIVSLKPDCVLTTAPTQERVTEKLEKLGVKTLELNPESLAGLERCVALIGSLLDRVASADSLVEDLKGSVDELRELTSEVKPKRRVFLEIDTNPIVAPGPRSFVGELIVLAGGENIVESSFEYPVINPEYIIEKDPEVIVVANPGVSVDEVRSRIGWGELSAVKHGRVYSIDPDLISRPGPRALKGAFALFRLFYPEEPDTAARR
jgi:iron complex transport system substrate-binding protein